MFYLTELTELNELIIKMKCQNNNIFTVKKLFLSFAPLQKIKEIIHDSNLSLDVDVQKEILNNTVKCDLIEKYPLKKSYQKSFLKCLIEELEHRQEEILDDLYNEYCNMILQEDARESHYRHFILDNSNDSNYITIQESINIISQGTTGLCSWQAAFVLSEWCIENKQKFEGKVILELGSGVGLLGLSVIHMCSPKEYIFTDGHAKVLSMLCHNISTNFAESSNNIHIQSDINEQLDVHFVHKNTDIKVKNLLWEDIESWISETNIQPDYILAADILFDASVFPSLVCGLKKILSIRKIEGYIAATVRNETTIKEFLDLLDKYNVSYQDEVVSKHKIFVHDKDTTVRVIKIS